MLTQAPESLHESDPIDAVIHLHGHVSEPTNMVLCQCTAHYHADRNHRGLENKLIREMRSVDASAWAIYRHPRLGGMLNFHYREAA